MQSLLEALGNATQKCIHLFTTFLHGHIVVVPAFKFWAETKVYVFGWGSICVKLFDVKALVIYYLEVESWQLDFFLIRLKCFAAHPSSFFSLRRVGRRPLIYLSSPLVSLPPGLNRLVRWTKDEGGEGKSLLCSPSPPIVLGH